MHWRYEPGRDAFHRVPNLAFKERDDVETELKEELPAFRGLVVPTDAR
jgi:hypothetical protein